MASDFQGCDMVFSLQGLPEIACSHSTAVVSGEALLVESKEYSICCPWKSTASLRKHCRKWCQYEDRRYQPARVCSRSLRLQDREGKHLRQRHFTQVRIVVWGGRLNSGQSFIFKRFAVILSLQVSTSDFEVQWCPHRMFLLHVFRIQRSYFENGYFESMYPIKPWSHS